MNKVNEFLSNHKEKVGLVIAALLLVLAFKGILGGGFLETAAKMVGAYALGFNFKSLLIKLEAKVKAMEAKAAELKSKL